MATTVSDRVVSRLLSIETNADCAGVGASFSLLIDFAAAAAAAVAGVATSETDG